jgi:2-polyprenyl-3-methyl-5-hydroxy-6-metoxy-1,4-benzoquinol methylase
MEHIVDRPFYSAYAWAYDLLITRPVSHDCAGITMLLAQHGVAPGARILDAGCGTGSYTLELAERGYVVTGLDVSVPLLMEAQKRANHGHASLTLVCGNLLTLPFAPHYDGILCRGVLNDLLDTVSRQQVFFFFARALRPGGCSSWMSATGSGQSPASVRSRSLSTRWSRHAAPSPSAV